MRQMQDDDVTAAARTNVPVLITSENADEREKYARLIHGIRPGGIGPFVAYRDNGPAGSTRQEAADCVGDHHSRDNGSLRQRFNQARGGTLFIDDIAALTVDAQLQLLSLTEECRRPDSDYVVRIVAGASRPLDAECTSGAFSDRLFYRLNMIHLHVNGEAGTRRTDEVRAVG